MKTFIGFSLLIAAAAIPFIPSLWAEDVGVSIKDNAVTHAMLNSLVEKCTTTTLTSSQMDTLNASPVTLVAAPSTSYAYLVTSVYAIARSGGTPFELGSGTLSVKYTNASGESVAAVIPNSTVETATQSNYDAIPVSAVMADTASLVLTASADVTAGDGTMTVRVCYKTNPTNYLLVP